MNEQSFQALAQAVQRNCHISDARFGADDSLCVYLMRMREYFRWEMKLPLGAMLKTDQVGSWLQAREKMWEELEEAELAAIEIDGERFDPFDAAAINARLTPHGLVYSGGLGTRAKPHFVLGDLERQIHLGDHDVFVVASEHARDLTAPPAMTLSHTIFVRRESLRRMLWEKLESWRWARADNALGRAFACYDFEQELAGSLDAMAEREIETLLLHEEGEYQAGVALGAHWAPMLMDLVQTPAEIMARAVRDHLADCLVTLPHLIGALEAGGRAGDGGKPGTDRRGAEASIHFFLGNLTNMRKEIFPGLTAAYRHWLASGETAPLRSVTNDGRGHFDRLARGMIELYLADPDQADGRIRELVEASFL